MFRFGQSRSFADGTALIIRGRSLEGYVRRGRYAFEVIVLLAFGFVPWSLATAKDAKKKDHPRVVIVVRQGDLAPEETSPRSRGNAPTLWKCALKGTSVATLKTKRDLAAELDLSRLAKRLLSKSVYKAEDKEVLLVDLKKPATTWSEGPPKDPIPFGELYTVVRPKEAPDSFQGARVVVVRVRSAGLDDDEVKGRDHFLAALLNRCDPQVHVFVVNVPAGGAASLVARGPSVKPGRILGDEHSFSMIRRAVDSLLGEPSSKRRRHELFN